MKKEIFRSKFVRCYFDASRCLYISEYLKTTEDMTDEEWKIQMKEIAKSYTSFPPICIIDDNRNRKYAYTPEMQKWTLALFVQRWNEIGVRKYAQVLPSEILGKLTSMQIEEQAVSDFHMHFEYKMLDDMEEALKWIDE